MAEREQGGVDPVLQRGAVAHQVQPPAGPFPLGAHRRGGQPDRRDQVATGQLGQQPRVDLVGLAGQRGQPLDLLRVGDLDLPARQLQLVVHEPGAVHRLDRGIHRPVELRTDPRGQRGQPARLGQRRGHRQRCPRLVHHMDIKPRSTQVQPDVHHDNRPPSDTSCRPSTSKRAPGGGPRLHDIQFTTEIDGMDIHFVHVKSEHQDALPLIMTHGWPGSVIEMLDSVGPLTNPTAHGGSAADAFDLVLPSLPGYGFSAEPADLGWDLGRTARAWAELMHRLGYTRYVAQGGDVGAGVTDAMGRQAPDGLLGIHTNLLVTALGALDSLPVQTDKERVALAAIRTFQSSGIGYFTEQATRPQTIGYALLDSPAALAAWMLDHDTDAYYKIARAFVDGQPSGNLTRDNILDNITLYWLTGTGASAARSYWEAYGPD